MRKATRRTGPEQGRNTTQRRGTRGGGGACGAVVRADKAQANLAKGPSEKRQGRAATGQSKIVAEVCVGEGVNPRRRSGRRLSRIENSEGQQGAKPGPGREKGGTRQAREDRVGKPAHTRSVRCRKSCDAPVGEQTQAGRAPVRFHARERRWRQKRRPCDSCHHGRSGVSEGGGWGVEGTDKQTRCSCSSVPACRSSG